MPAVAAQLVGRAAELEALEQALDEVSRGGSSALELLGEPGIGKTRLLSELSERAEARKHLVLSGSASELERDVPFGVFVDALDDYVQALDPQRLRGLDPALAHVLPSLEPAAGEPATLQMERYRLHRAVRSLLEAVAAARPLVLALDDLHWADSGSVELLAALLRQPPAAPVLLALASRARQADERLAAALDRANRTGALTRLELRALDAGQARELLGDAVGAAEAESLYEQTGGNPFSLHELARATGRAAAPARAVTVAGVPPPVASALAEELALLDDGARRLLEGAAVAGDPFEPELAAAAAGVSEAAALGVLDELLQRDLVRGTDVPRRFRFRHPLVRRAIYEASPAGWRLGAHERCAEALAARGAGAAARAHHVEQAARHGDAAAIAVLREAGEEVARRTPAAAARWLEAALRLLPAATPVAERVALLVPLARSRAATGDFEQARAALLEAIELAPDAGLRVQLVAGCAAIEQLLGRHQDARARLQDALADAGEHEVVALMNELAVSAYFSMDYERSVQWATQALELARALEQPALIAAGAAMSSLALAFASRVEEAERRRAEAQALIDAMPDAELAARLDAIAHLSGAEGYLDRFQEGVAHAQRAFAIARATEQEQLFPILIPAVNASLCALGRLDEAAELLEGAVESARLVGNPQTVAWSLLSMASVRMLQGDLGAALTHVAESTELSRGFDDSVVTWWQEIVDGLIMLLAGEPQRGVESLIAGGGGPSLPRAPGGWRAWYLEALTQGWLALGRREEASRAARDAEAVAAATGLRFARAAALRARARVTLDAGGARQAAEQALEAAALCDALGARIETASSRLLAGRALAAAGDADGAVGELQRAAAELDACGAARQRAEAERELRRLGQRVHRRTAAGQRDGAGVEQLTERELQVARLVVDRRTNAQIAAELFLSVKTVETHMRNLFQKLGVSSRVQVAHAIERAGDDGRR